MKTEDKETNKTSKVDKAIIDRLHKQKINKLNHGAKVFKR